MNPIIEILRVLGALMVLTHHYTYQLSSDLATDWSSLHFFHNGVDLFFVITGYLFAPFLLGEKRVVALKFLKRRFFRLYPLYLLSLFTFVVSATESWPPAALLAEHVLLLQSLPYHTLAETGVAISLVYWTLAVEFQFYLFVVAVAWLYGHDRH
jgi:exopolysaccharide production protein ExoZ